MPDLNLTGRARVDLTTVDPERMPARLHSLATVPSGARAVVIVAALRAEPSAVRELREIARRLHVEIEGEPWNVPRWLEAIRDGLPGEMLGGGQ